MSSQILVDASEHSIKSVTIFSSSKAEVIRNFSVNLEKGHNEVKISSLPSSIDTESARVTGLGDAVLFDVVCIISGDRPQLEDKRSDALKELERKKAVLQSEKSIRGHEADMLAQYGYTLNAENNITVNAESFLDTFVKRARTIIQDSAKIDEEVSVIDKEIAEEEHKEAQKLKRTSTHGRVTAVIMANRSGTIQMTLTYMVSGAAWNPTYDLRAATEGGKPPKTVTLHYRAAIVQNTGEDWTNTNLSLSTASPGIFAQLPILRPLRIVPLIKSGNNTSNAHNFPNLHSMMQSQQRTQPGLFGQSNLQQQQPIVQQEAALLQQRRQQRQLEAALQQPQMQQQAAPGPSSGFGTFEAFGNTPRPAFGAVPASTTGGLFGVPAARSAPSGAASLFGARSTGSPSNISQGINLNTPVLNGLLSTRTSGTADGGLFGAVPQQEQTNVDDTSSWTTVDAITDSVAQDPVGDGEISGSWSSSATSVTESAVASSFRIDGLCSIPSDSSSHKVTVAVLPFEADVHYIAAPRTTPVAFLQCAVTNTSEYRLLRGPVSVYMDESPVSKTFIGDVNPEEMFRCTLGPDPSIRIKLIRHPRAVTTVGSAFAARTTSASYKQSLSVQNTHTFSVRDLILRDSVPLPSTENTASPEVKVVLKEPAGLSEAAAGVLVDVKNAQGGSNTSAKVRWEKIIGDKEGKYEWVLHVDAGEQIKLESEYEVRAPSDFNWTLQESIF